MESIILSTLEWRMNPPTVQEFIILFLQLIFSDLSEVSTVIYERATFFAELSAYEYQFVSLPRHHIAAACVLNALDVFEGASGIPNQQTLIHSLRILQETGNECICDVSDLVVVDDLKSTQAQLWYLHSRSAQVAVDDCIIPCMMQSRYHQQRPTTATGNDRNEGVKKIHTDGGDSDGDTTTSLHSPVSVRIKNRSRV
jgi:hypothetical protein